MNNFRQYKGKSEVHFSKDPDRNTTVFLGDNSAGKSTLVEAFRWALYGRDLNLDYKQDVLNKEVVNGMYSGKEEKVSVEVELIHSDIRHVFRREVLYVCTDIGKVRVKDELPVFAWVYDDGDKERRENPHELIQKILPESLAGYFFFDGEHIEKLHQSKNLKDSISILMGLKPLKEAVNHLKEVNKAFLNQCASGTSAKEQDLQRKLEQNQEALKEAEKVLKREEKNVEILRELFEEAEQNFNDNKKTIDYSIEIKKIDAELKKKSEYINNVLIEISEIFNKTYLNIFSYDIVTKSLELLNESMNNKIIKESVPGVNAESINRILERGKCICGSELKSNPELIENLKLELNFIPPRSIGTEILLFNKGVKAENNAVPIYKDNLEKRYMTFIDQLDEIDNLERRHNELLSKSAGLSDEEASKIAKKYNSYKQQYNTATSKLRSLDSRVIDAEKELGKTEDDIKRLAIIDEKNKVPMLCSRYTEQLIAEIQSTIDVKEKNIYNEFSHKLEEIFEKMYHGERVIGLTEKYEIKQYTAAGETSLSTGTKVMLGFAFVATLLSMAREELNRGDSDVETEPYPLVMDAPTSDLDATHIGNAFEYISDVAEQIILMMTDKDWEHAKNALGHRIDKVYRLSKTSETHTKIIEEDQNVR